MKKKYLGYLALAVAVIAALAYALTATYGHKPRNHENEISKSGHHGGGHHKSHHKHHHKHHHGHHGHHHWNHHHGNNGKWGDWNGGYIEGEGIYSPGYIYSEPTQSYYYTEPAQAIPGNVIIPNVVPTPIKTTTPSAK